MKFEKSYKFIFKKECIKVYVKHIDYCDGVFDLDSRWPPQSIVAISSIGIKKHRNVKFVYMSDGTIFPAFRLNMDEFSRQAGLTKIHRTCSVNLTAINRIKFESRHHKNRIESIGLVGHLCMFPFASRSKLFKSQKAYRL